MKFCPITYESIPQNETYSRTGLRLLSPQLESLQPIDLSKEEQRNEAILRAGKMSIQGVQIKLSSVLKIKESHFEVVDQFGKYILKPQSLDYPELPENEAISMSMAALLDIEVPIHGLVYSKDKSMTYFIKRFDRTGHNKKLALEDFGQLLGVDRDVKYASSMEKVISVIEKYCTFPKREYLKLFKLTLFNFLIGNEDMHLKNFSLITQDQIVSLSPAYDLLNTSIVLNGKEEIALPINGKKHNLRKSDLLDYFAKERLTLNNAVIDGVLAKIQTVKPIWFNLIDRSFLSEEMKKKYLDLMADRFGRLF